LMGHWIRRKKKCFREFNFNCKMRESIIKEVQFEVDIIRWGKISHTGMWMETIVGIGNAKIKNTHYVRMRPNCSLNACMRLVQQK
jgi:hypothetical protein